MPHDTPLISTIVGGLVLAFILGAIANRLRLPPLVGYLVAGIAVGPFTPGFVADADLALQLAEIGVILLMFGVGLHFSLKDLLSVRALAVPGAVVQIGGATLMGLGLAMLMGWGVGAGLIFGLSLSVASTVVLLKAMQDRRLIDSERGRIAVGWLIVEDLAMVLALVLIPAIASLGNAAAVDLHDPFISFVERLFGTQLGIVGILAVTVVKMAAFVGCMLVIGRRVIPYVLHATAHTGSRELFRLAVLAIALGVAAGASYLFGVSLALGAFFAGMILSESELSHRAAQETLPLRDAFSVLFFVSVGMLFDPSILLHDPLPVLATVFIIVIGKSLFAFLIVIAFRNPVGTALTISASLAQIGEFSFILAALGVGLGILPTEARDLILAGAIISIVLNPVAFWGIDILKPHLEKRFAPVRGAEPVLAGGPAAEVTPDGPITMATVSEHTPPPPQMRIDIEPTSAPTRLSGHTILVGYGRVGTVVAEGLLAAQHPFLLIEDAEGRINAARQRGIEVIVGNAASPAVLARANVEEAREVVIAIPNAFEAGQATEQCRKLNPAIRIVARAHSDEEVAHLTSLGANSVVIGEREIGRGMLGWLDGERPDLAGPEPEIEEPAMVPPMPASLAVVEAMEPEVVKPEMVETEAMAPEAVAPEVIAAAPDSVPEPVVVADLPIEAEAVEAVEPASPEVSPDAPPPLAGPTSEPEVAPVDTPEPEEPGVVPPVVVEPRNA